MQPKRNCAYQRRTGKLSLRKTALLRESPYLIRDHTQTITPALFPNNSPIFCEIGFGKGHYLLEQANLHPTRNFLGIDLYLPGVASVLGQLEANKTPNIKLIAHDASEVITSMLPAYSLAHVAILHPDPWPKKRHHKRRLITQEFLNQVATCLQHNGQIQIVSDDASYSEWINDTLQALPYHYHINSNISPFTKYGNKAMTYNNTITEFIITITHRNLTSAS